MDMATPHTDPTAKPVPIRADIAPFVIGQARLACNEIRVVAESVQRDCGSQDLRKQATRLQQQAIRLGQVANALSAVDIDGIALLHIDPRATLWQRIKGAFRLCYVLIVRKDR